MFEYRRRGRTPNSYLSSSFNLQIIATLGAAFGRKLSASVSIAVTLFVVINAGLPDAMNVFQTFDGRWTS